jgi:hypothetical protein
MYSTFYGLNQWQSAKLNSGCNSGNGAQLLSSQALCTFPLHPLWRSYFSASLQGKQSTDS